MGIHQFLGQVKAGDGMEAIERESNRLGVKNVVRGARLGLKVASQLLSAYQLGDLLAGVVKLHVRVRFLPISAHQAWRATAGIKSSCVRSGLG
eukprot:COSAG02_NODE_38184_length_432_cov_0.885886_1_plen_92_part_01